MTVRIPTRSKRQAMDWSLVLISQGIGSTIDQSDEVGWGLVVEEGDHERALSSIQQYHAENSGWSWRQKIRPEVLFDWGSLAWVVLVCAFYWLIDRQPHARDAALMDATAVSHGEWWRLFTAIFLHADLGHLLANVGTGFVLLGLAMGRYGTGVGLLAAYLTGAGGNVLTWLVFRDHHSLGASGMVMGCLGLLAPQGIPVVGRNRKKWKYMIAGIVASVMLFVLLGLNPDSDVLAHLGGFLSGILLGIILIRIRRKKENTTADIFAGVLFALLMILTWWLALSSL